MATIIIPPKKSLLTLLSALFMLVAFTACSSSEGNNSDEPERPQPETPVNDDDWQTVPVSGGTIEKGDISITFPSGTFASDAKVAITEAPKGGSFNQFEASPFYQVSFSSRTKAPIKVRIKGNEQSSDMHIVSIAPGIRWSAQDATNYSLSLEGSYTDGAYEVTLPRMKGDDEGDLDYITLGLIKSPDNSRVAGTRLWDDIEIAGKVKNIEWYFDIGTIDYYLLSDPERVRLEQYRSRISDYIEEALGIIHGLGFSIKTNENETRRIPIIFVNDTKYPNAYGFFEQSYFADTHSCIQLNMVKLFSADTDETSIRQTVIHELLHYFQADYDPRCPTIKKIGGEENALYEAVSVWAEQFMDNGKMNADFIGDYISQFLKGFDTVVQSYQNHGYGMSTLFYYLTSPIGDMKAWGIDKNSIVELFQLWQEGNNAYIGHSFSTIREWLRRHGSDFLISDDYDKYLLSVISGELIKGQIFNPDSLNSGSDNLKSVEKIPHDDKCGDLGCDIFKVGLAYYYKNNPSFKGKEFVVKQLTEGLRTYVFVGNSSSTKFERLSQICVAGDSLVIDGDYLDGMMGGEKKGGLYLITTNNTSKAMDFQETIELKEKQEETEINIKSVKFHAGIDFSWENHVGPYGESFDYYSTNNNCTLNGNTLHVECGPNEADVWPGGAGAPNFDSGGDFLSFDIVGVNSDSKEWRIENLIHKYGRRRINLPSTDISSDIYLVAYNSDLQLTNMVMSESLSKGPSKLVFTDWDKYGFEVTNAYVERIFSDDSKWVYHFNKVSGGVKLTLDTTP